MIRQPIVAGKFYPATKEAIRKQLRLFLSEPVKKEEAIACIMPHAGYIYSGEVATKTAASIELKENIILLGPNHTGMGDTFSITTDKEWVTPLGSIKIDTEVVQHLKKECSLIKENNSAHNYEHSLEVQLPILQYLAKKEFSIIPMILMSSSKSNYEKIAQAIYQTIIDLNISDKTTIIASSDMTHYESQKSANRKDHLAIEAILKLDEDLFLGNIDKYDISMCGYVPSVIAIITAKKLGANRAKLVKYMTSGDSTGDYNSVVGYAGITIS